ncbi:hypothetical protein [Devosia sp. 63-57]|uniref:hypothetical protein n=1 Tax=Devosia sp. 63-57 TaxID=1895751 RepID=UPI00086A9BAD|nr:hypothetical protein [Devosia sp. 63-57]ODT50010.1 MAG: hypothetical protein ABS74_05855 [Pelagibacterium sp. SCN 63-126]ODU81290.1 MAG: hypothetical protein ABT14_18110 [Pelagibacterium sp. SCN 63-17]OJX45307.1 MAG: hypothetical protein BGO80_05660 [Devosia sp. 63-57]
MRQVLKAFIVLVVTTFAPPSFATGVDGVWECKAFGTLVATIGFEGRNYVLANKSGQSGRGEVGEVDASFDMFVVRSGPLYDDLGIVGGRRNLGTDKPTLTLLGQQGGNLVCDAKL